LQTKVKHLSLKKKWSAGRNDTGRIVVWTKGSLKKKLKMPLINLNLRYNKLAVISTFQFIPFKNKLLTVLCYNNGAISYHNATENFNLFEYFYWNRKKSINKFHSKIFWSLLFLIKKLSFLSFIELLPEKGAQYVLSSGCKAKLFNIDKSSLSCLVILPSKVKKIFSCFSAALLGQNLVEEKRKYFNSKSGYWRSFGFKPIVRGVAMNPVDHPHGGRTKAIRHQRTPWGKTTKKK
jgi:large subunit ribosomal protein L2